MGLTPTFSYLHLLEVEGAPVAHGPDDPLRDKVLAEPGVLGDWSTLELELRGDFLPDYLANDVGVRLCSPRLREVIDRHRGPGDELQWLDAQVTDGANQEHTYFVLRFVSYPDVLHAGRTIRASGGFVVKAVLDANQVADHGVFSFPGGTMRTIVAGEVRHAIVAAGCTGVDFSGVPVV